LMATDWRCDKAIPPPTRPALQHAVAAGVAS